MSDESCDYTQSVIVDNREGKIITELERTTPFEYTKANLDIGDFKFELGKKKILIERKTVDDLISSIKDGRYKEQKYRLMNEQRNNTIVIYLIEGDIWKSKKFKPDTLYSAIVNTMIRDNIHVYISKDIEHTVLFLTKIYKQMEKNKEAFIKDVTPPNEEDTSYAQFIKPNKKANITPKICYINQLCQIPGISYKYAVGITDVYPTMKILVNTSHEELSGLRVNGRRVPGRIIEALLCH